MPFHNPYHFVPVQKGGRTDDLDRTAFANGEHGARGQVTHDRYAPNTRSGRIICRLTALSPFVVGGVQQPDTQQCEPTIVEQFEIGGRPAIPATTLRGMLSSIVEAASNSSLRVLMDEAYSFRRTKEEALKRLGMLIELKGRMMLRPLGRIGGGEIVRFRPDDPGKYRTFDIANPKYFYMDRTATDPTQLQPLSEQEFRALQPARRSNYDQGILRVLADETRAVKFAETGRRNEIFICWDPANPEEGRFDQASKLLEIRESAIRNFERIAAQRNEVDPELPYTTNPAGSPQSNGSTELGVSLAHGDIVYYRQEGGDLSPVVEVSFSAIWRGIVARNGNPESVHDFFRTVDPELVQFNRSRTLLTLAEQMFGFVEDVPKGTKDILALAGRVFPSAALFAGLRQPDGQLEPAERREDCHLLNSTTADGWTILKELSQPKPPCPAMYFKRKGGNGHIAKKDLNSVACEPQGRKFYLSRSTNEGRPWETTNSESHGNHRKMKVRPVRAGATFYFHVDFTNLSDPELGALLFALSPSEGFVHKIGLGKPIGLGSVEIMPVGYFEIDRRDRYTLEGLWNPRYSHVWKHANDPDYPSHYAQEQVAALTMSDVEFAGLRDDFPVSAEIRQAIKAIGTPVELPITYPKLVGQIGEDESFRWFVDNDMRRKQQLKPISNGSIPTLNE